MSTDEKKEGQGLRQDEKQLGLAMETVQRGCDATSEKKADVDTGEAKERRARKWK